MIFRRRYLTLIEILIVVSILLLVTGVIGFNIRRALVTQRFNTETALFIDSIRLAQDMMLILSKDVQLKVRNSPQGEGLESFIEVEGGVPKGWDNVMKRSRRALKSIHYIAFVQQDSFPTQPDQIVLRFQSKGSMMSKGELRFASHEDPFTVNAMRRAVCLKGYPHAINSSIVSRVPARGEMWAVCEDEEEDKSFFEQLTAYMKEEIEQDQPAKATQESESQKSGEKKEEKNDQAQ